MIRVGRTRNLLRASSSLSEIWPRSAHHHLGQRHLSGRTNRPDKSPHSITCLRFRNSLQMRAASTREGSTAVPLPPPLASAKPFSRSDCARIFPLFSGVMRARLLTGTLPSRPESVLSAPIFSRPVACAVLVNRYQTSVYQGNYSDVNPTWMGVASGADATRVELSGDPSPLILQPALRPVPFRRSRSRWSRCEARQRED